MLPEEAAAVGEDYDNKKSPEPDSTTKLQVPAFLRSPAQLLFSRSVGFL